MRLMRTLVHLHAVRNAMLHAGIDRYEIMKMDFYIARLERLGEEVLSPESESSALNMVAAAYALIDAAKSKNYAGGKRRARPPQKVEQVFSYVFPRRERNAILGDLEERFHKNVAGFGERKARRIYVAEFFWSALPSLSRRLLGLERDAFRLKRIRR